jgi:hypothetical protein
MAGEKPGLLAVSRFDPSTGREVLIAFNTSFKSITGDVEVETGSERWTALHGACPAAAAAPGSLRVSIPGFGFLICAAQ